MRLARDQKDPQAVADAVDLDDGCVVARGQFARLFRKGELDHVHAAVLQSHGQFQVAVGGHLEALRLVAVDRDLDLGHLGQTRRDGTLIFDPKGQRHRFADDGEGGRVLKYQAAVPIGLLARQQRVKRRGHLGQAFEVVKLTVGQKDRARDARARFLGHGVRQRLHQKRAAIAFAVAQPHDAQFGIRQRRDLGLDTRHRLGDLVGPDVDTLACAFVDDQDHDVGQRLAFLDLKRRVRQR